MIFDQTLITVLRIETCRNAKSRAKLVGNKQADCVDGLLKDFDTQTALNV